MSKVTRFLGRRSSWSVPYFIFMLFFVLAPLLIMVWYAFTDAEGHLTFYNAVEFFHEKEAINTLIYSVGIALINTLLCILIGYPAAYFLSNSNINRSSILVVLFLLPMLINVLVRTLATVALFGWMRIPLGQGTLIFGMVYNYLPFMILPIYNVLSKLDKSYLEAAQDLGASPLEAFFKVTLPLSVPGIISGVMMVFMPTISTFAIAELLTMNNIKLFGTIIQENINNGMWNYGAMLSMIMLIFIIIMNALSGDEDDQAGAGVGGLI